MSLLMYALVLIACVAAPFAFFIRRLLTRNGNENVAEWLDNFSLDQYRPMERLLKESDYAFLATQAGYRPSIAKELRAERREIFRSYLYELVGDFHQLVSIANLMIVYSQEDRADLLHTIFRLRMRFYWNVFQAEASLIAGPVLGQVDASRLLGPLAAMRDNISQLAPQPTA